MTARPKTGTSTPGHGRPPRDPVIAPPRDSFETPTAPSAPPEVDTTPNAFAFAAVTGAELNTAYESNTITVSGLSDGVSVAMTIVGGSYEKNGGETSSAETTVQNGDTVSVHVTSSGENSTDVEAVLTIGGVSATYRVRTEALPSSPGEGLSSVAEILAAIENGETDIVLGDADFGALSLSGKSGFTLTGGPGARFRTINMSGCSDITLDGFGIDWTAQDGDGAKTIVFRLASCSDITITGLTMTGHLVPEGVLNARHTTDLPTPGQNAFLVDYYAGCAISLTSCQRVTIEENTISGFFQGIGMGGATSADITIRKNIITELRTTPIKGYGVNVTIDRNQTGSQHPYRYVNSSGVPSGDHLDGIHMFTGSGNPPMSGLVVTKNLIDCSDGYDAIGILIGDNGVVGIPGATFSENTIITGNTQGISLVAACTNTTVTDNVMRAPPGSTKLPILYRRTATFAAVTGNDWYDSIVNPKLSTVFDDNDYVTPRVAATAEEIDAVVANALAVIAA